MPHNGCPHKCSFCNQVKITGQQYQPTQQDVKDAAEIAVKSLGDECRNAEIAFFGGSFTAIDKDYMVSLLEAAFPYVSSGKFHGIRISTRPDCIDDDILTLLKKYGVTAIELGAQSMDNNVLIFNNRGHTAEDVANASRLIRKYGFSLGLQMMIGLYKSTPGADIETARRIAQLKPDTVRIYPTVIMRGTYLGELFESGEYVPYDIETAVEICARLITFFDENGIKIIRLGLHDSESLKKDMLGGLWHPAFRELCESRIMYDKCIALIREKGLQDKKIIIRVNPKNISRMLGQRRSNLIKFSAEGFGVDIRQDADLTLSDIIVEKAQT